MQDEYGRPLSDDGRWVWDGSAWRPTDVESPPTGYEPTTLAPGSYGASGGRQPQPYGQGYPGPVSGPQGYYAGPGGPGSGPQPVFGPAGPGGPYGPRPNPWWKRPSVFIGALLVISAVLVTVILLTRHDGSSTDAKTTPSPTPAATSAPPTPTPTPTPTETPTPTPTDTPTAPPTGPSEIAPGFYDCTSNGRAFGTVDFSGTTYTTDSMAVGTYTYDPTTGDISFTGGDLGDYTGTYHPGGPSLDLVASDGTAVHCAQ